MSRSKTQTVSKTVKGNILAYTQRETHENNIRPFSSAILKSRKYISIPESKYLPTKTASEVFF